MKDRGHISGPTEMVVPTIDQMLDRAEASMMRIAPALPPIDMNAARKRKEGRENKGLCPCGIYFSLSCRTYCLKSGERHS